MTEHTRNQIFLERYPKNFFFKIFFLVLFDRFLEGFSKFGFFIGEICILIGDFWVIFENYSMHMLSIRGTNFIAHWAYGELISSHAEHTGNRFYCMLSMRRLDRIEYDFQKSRAGPWDHKDLVSAKKSKKKFHACVHLKGPKLEIFDRGFSWFLHHKVFMGRWFSCKNINLLFLFLRELSRI